MATLSIVIPTYNGKHHLQRCLPSVLRNAPNGTQFIVADDASTDGTCEWLIGRFPEIEIVRLPENLGYCQAANAGLARARGDVIELLNNDTEVQPAWAEAAIQHFTDPTVGSVAPLALQMNDRTRIDSAGQEYHICGWAIPRGYNRRVGSQYLVSREVFGPSASCGFYRREAIRQAGGFAAEYEAYLEDTDLALRLRWAGWRCIYEPNSRVLHHGSGSYGGGNPRVTRLLARNEEFNFWTHVPASRMAVALPMHLAFVSVRAMSQLARGGFRPFMHGKWEAVRSWQWLLRRRQHLRREFGSNQNRVARCLSQSATAAVAGLNWLARRQCA